MAKKQYNNRISGEEWGMRQWIVEMTIKDRVRPVKVTAENREGAKDKAEAKHPYPKATRTWNAYTMAEWAEILKAHEERKRP